MKATKAISEKEAAIIKAIEKNPGATNKTIVEKTGIGRETVRLAVKKLVESGLVIAKIGENKAITFIVKEQKTSAKEVTKKATESKKPEAKPQAEQKLSKTQADNDRRKIQYKGQVYGKGKFFLIMMTDYINGLAKRPTLKQVQEVWLNRYHRKYGCIQDIATAMEKSKTQKRFFVREDQQIKLADCTAAVCSDWGSKNIEEVLRKGRDLGFKFEYVNA